MTNHLNHMDKKGRVYCKKLNSVVKLADLWDPHCLEDCVRLSGYFKEDGVECLWYDADYDYPMVHIYDPFAEYARYNLLADSSAAVPARSAEKEIAPVKGIYFIMIKKLSKLPVELRVHQKQIAADKHVIYIGKAGNKQGLWQRLLLQDLQHRRGPSTFFRSVGAVLGYEPEQNLRGKKTRNYRFSPEDTQAIRTWINCNLFVNVKEIPDEPLGELEKGLIKSFRPCFNVADNPNPCQYVVDQRARCLRQWVAGSKAQEK